METEVSNASCLPSQLLRRNAEAGFKCQVLFFLMFIVFTLKIKTDLSKLVSSKNKVKH